MNQQEQADTPRPEEPSQAVSDDTAGSLEATRGIDLGGLLGGVLGSTGDEETGRPGASAAEVGGGLGGLLDSLLGGDTVALSGQAGALGISPTVLQAIAPLILGILVRGGEAEGGVSRAALDDLAQGKAGAADALTGSGLLQEIMRRTGLDTKGALGVIIAVLKALGVGKTTTSSQSKPKPKPKPKPASSAKPKTKPKPKPKPASGTSAAKPKPKPASSTGATKPKPKPSTSSKPKSKPKPRPKRTGEVAEDV